jgi:AcrR family transcriptional regulator
MARSSIDVSRKAKQSSSRREEILTVAAHVLREKGLGMSLQDIADELGVTYNALYHHFKSREDLLLHCFLRSTELVDEALTEADEAATGLEKVMTFLRVFVDRATTATTPPGRYVVALRDDARRIVTEHDKAARERLIRFVETGVADGSITDCDPHVTGVWILHSLCWWPEELYRQRPGVDVTASIFALIRRAIAA